MGQPSDYPETQLTPWSHQQDAMDFLYPRTKSALFGDMAVGKTKVAVDRIIGKRFDKTLVIGPAKSVQVWKDEIKKHAGKPVIVSSSKEGNAKDQAQRHYKHLQSDESNIHIVVTNYGMLDQPDMRQFLDFVNWDHMILDESHNIKAVDGKRSRFLFTLGVNVEDKLILTGTPMDKPEDIFAQYRFMNHEIFGSAFSEFKDEFCVIRENSMGFRDIVSYKNQDELHRRINQHAYRITDDVLDLPELLELDRYCTMPFDYRQKYYQDMPSFLSSVNEKQDAVSEQQLRQQIMKNRKQASGFIDSECQSDHKLSRLSDVLDEFDHPDPLIIFAYFHDEIDILHEFLEKQEGYTTGELSGRVDDRNRWKNNECNAMIVQMQAGSESINALNTSNHAIFFSPTYSYITYAQAKKRIHRPGTDETVRVIRLCVEDSIEVSMRDAVDEKMNIASKLLDN